MSRVTPEATPTGHPRDAALEQLAFEPEAADAGVRDHVDGCEACRSAVATLEAERRGFLAERPARPFVAGVVARAEREQEAEAARRRPAWLDAFLPPRWLLVPAAAAAVLLVVLAVPRGPWHDEDATHFKGGGAALRLFHARGTAEARPLDPGVSLRPGDLLRFGVLQARGRQVAVVSVDEAGRFSRYYPPEAAPAGPLQGSGALQLLPGSIELDDTVGREWIVLVLSERPLDEARLREALRAAWQARRGERLGPLGLDAETDVVPILKTRA